MSGLALLVVAAAALVWIGQWISVRAGVAPGGSSLPPRLHARLVWWGSHRTVVGAACVAVAAAGLTGGLLAG